MRGHAEIDSAQEAMAWLAGQRRARRLRQEDMAQQLGIGQQHVSYLEAGKGDPTLAQLQSYAQALGMTLAITVSWEA